MSYKDLSLFIISIFFAACSNTGGISAKEDDECDNSYNFKSNTLQENKKKILEYNDITHTYKFKDTAK
ncbi:hypothetical protein KKA17_02900 [bacterium]|nr:hypothetical protein [bacterium]MBU1883382.1 hypothetical protein [bacterium]